MSFLGRTSLQPRAYGIWVYKTTDAAATVAAANYFLAAYDVFEIGDRILVTTVTGLATASEAYVGQSNLVVTARTSSSVTTVAM